MKKSLFKKFIIGMFLITGIFAIATIFVNTKVHADGEHTHSNNPGLQYTAWTNIDSLPTTAGNYYLENDVTISNTWEPESGICLCLNGHGIIKTGVGNVIKVNNNLRLIDCSNVEHKYEIDSQTGLARVNDTLGDDAPKFKGGYITGGNGVETGGGIYVVANAYIELSNITILGNSTTGSGGAIYYEKDAYHLQILENISIIGNYAEKVAGGIYASSHTSNEENKDVEISLKSNTIVTKNTSKQSPAGIYVEDSLVFQRSTTEPIYVYVYENMVKNGENLIPADISVVNGKPKELVVLDLKYSTSNNVKNFEGHTFDENSKIGYFKLDSGKIYRYYENPNNTQDINEVFISNTYHTLTRDGETNDAIPSSYSDNYTVAYDEEPHSMRLISKLDSYDCELKYGEKEGEYTLDNPLEFTEIGEHTTYYELKTFITINEERLSLDTIYGKQTITIVERDSHMPVGNKELPYTGEPQDLITITQYEGITYNYKLKDGYWSEYVPKGTEIGDYTVYVRIFGDTEHGEIEQSVKASIVANDKTALVEEIDKTNTYYNSILEKYSSIAEIVKNVIDQANNLIEKTNATVSEINNMISSLKESVTTADRYKAQVDDVIAQIDAIGDVTLEKKEQIEAARASYTNILQEYKGLVSNYLELVMAEMKYKSLSLLNDRVNEVIDAINAIGDVTYDDATKARITDARTKYNLLVDLLKEKITNISTLEEKEAEYAKFEADHAAADEVIKLINNIGEVHFDDESRTKLDEVRAAYDALTEEQKPLVTNYQTLVDSESLYQSMKTDDDKANNVESLIDAIGDVSYTEEIKGKIDAARLAYDALTDGQKELVLNYSTLTVKEGQYANLVDDHNAAKNVENLINAIGDVTYTKECSDKIDAAKNAYKTLSSARKVLVTNVATLTSAESLYKDLEKTCKAIDAIDYVEYTVESKEKINAACALYDELSEENKAKITNYDTLKAAEDKYNSLSSAHASKVIWLIVIIVCIILVVALGVAYVLMFFVFNKYVIIKSKRRRVFKIGKKDNKIRLLKMNFRIIYRDEVDVYNKSN